MLLRILPLVLDKFSQARIERLWLFMCENGMEFEMCEHGVLYIKGESEPIHEVLAMCNEAVQAHAYENPD